MSDDDLIRRGDALAAITLGNTVTALQSAIRAIPPQGVRVKPLVGAAKAVVARWDTPAWKNAPATGVYINALRAALARLDAPAPQDKVRQAARVLLADAASEDHEAAYDDRWAKAYLAMAEKDTDAGKLEAALRQIAEGGEG